MRMITNQPFPNRIQWVLDNYVGPFVQDGPLGAHDPRRDLEVYVDGTPIPIRSFTFDAVNNRYLMYMNQNIDLQGVIQVVHHMPSPPFIDSSAAVLPSYAFIASYETTGDESLPPTAHAAAIPATAAFEVTGVTNATAQIYKYYSATLGGYTYGAVWSNFNLIDTLPLDAVIQGIFPVIIIPLSIYDICYRYLQYGLAGVATAAIVSPTVPPIIYPVTSVSAPILSERANGSTISGTFIGGETVAQAVTGATGIILNPAYWSDSDITFGNTITGSPDGTHNWVGQTSGAVYTPSEVPHSFGEFGSYTQIYQGDFSPQGANDGLIGSVTIGGFTNSSNNQSGSQLLASSNAFIILGSNPTDGTAETASATATSINWYNIEFWGGDTAIGEPAGSIGNTLSVIDDAVIQAMVDSSLLQGGLQDNIIVSAVGFAITYTSATPLIDTTITPPFAVPDGQGLAWSLPFTGEGLATGANGSNVVTPAIQTGHSDPILIVWVTSNIVQVRITGNNGVDPAVDTGYINTTGSGSYELISGFSTSINLTFDAYDTIGHLAISQTIVVTIT